MNFLKLMLGETVGVSAPEAKHVDPRDEDEIPKESKKKDLESAPVAPPEGKKGKEEKPEAAVIPPDAEEFKLSTAQTEPKPEEETASSTDPVLHANESPADGGGFTKRTDAIGALLGIHNEAARRREQRDSDEILEHKKAERIAHPQAYTGLGVKSKPADIYEHLIIRDEAGKPIGVRTEGEEKTPITEAEVVTPKIDATAMSMLGMTAPESIEEAMSSLPGIPGVTGDLLNQPLPPPPTKLYQSGVSKSMRKFI